VLHIPPAVASVAVNVLPVHTFITPLIAPGAELLTVTVVVTEQPVPAPTAYVIFDVPADTPDTTPVLATTVATAGEALLQYPPLAELLSVVVPPGHTVVVPVMAPGTALIDT